MSVRLGRWFVELHFRLLKWRFHLLHRLYVGNWANMVFKQQRLCVIHVNRKWAFFSCNREFKQQRFWATHVNRKWTFFSFNLPWGYQICVAKCLTLKETICPRICSKPLPTSVKSPISVNVRRSKTSLRKLPNISWRYQICIARCLYSSRHVLPGICSKSRLKSSKSPLPVDVRRSKTWLP